MSEREAFESTELFRELPLYAKEASKDGYLNRSLDNEYKIFCLGYKAALASQAQQEIKPYAYSVENCFGEKVMYIKEDDAIRYAKAANIREDQIFALYAKPLPPAPEGAK